MKIDKLIAQLQELQELYPDAQIYFTDTNSQGSFETFFQNFIIDEENDMIEMLFDVEDQYETDL